MCRQRNVTKEVQFDKQLHGTAMGSPVSVVVAEIVMQNIEEQALPTYTRTVPLWLRYVDDTFTAVHKDGINDFHEHLNRHNADIQFTKEIISNVHNTRVRLKQKFYYILSIYSLYSLIICYISLVIGNLA